MNLVDKRIMLYFIISLFLSRPVYGYTASELLHPKQQGKHGAECAWNYVDDGKDWAKTYPICATGLQQSPVALYAEDVTVDYSLPPLNLDHYGQTLNHSVLENNCHSTELKPQHVLRPPRLSGGGLKYEYEFVQMHVHWGSMDRQGSEDRFGNIQFPAEIHMVHTRIVANETNYDRANDPYAFAVLAILVELSDMSSVTLKRITDAMTNVTFAGSETYLDNVVLSELFPTNLGNFIQYHGSLTTPPCTEAVEWIIIPTPISITEDELNRMRRVQLAYAQNHGADHAFNNFRPPQPLNGRVVRSRYLVSLLPRKSAEKNCVEPVILLVFLLVSLGYC